MLPATAFKACSRPVLGKQTTNRCLSHKLRVASLQRPAVTQAEEMPPAILPVAVGIVGPGLIGSSLINQIAKQVGGLDHVVSLWFDNLA